MSLNEENKQDSEVEEKLKPVDESMDISISSNKMEAAVVFHPPKNEGKRLTIKEIKDQITKKEITYGIINENISEIDTGRLYEKRYVIAKGKSSIKGEDGYVDFKFNFNKKIEPKENEDGTVDFYNLDMIENVEKGDVLAEISEATKGEDGFTVLGTVIKSQPGKPAKVVNGKNTLLSDDGKNVTATVNGQVVYISGKIIVNDVYEVSKDVDHSIGNIDFKGSVVIRGNVVNGFKVKCDGDIDIYGVVEGANIEAKGDINLHRGVLGGNVATIKAGGNLVSKYIENSTVTVGGDLYGEAIMHSNVRCSGTIQVDGKKGLIVGGVVQAGNAVKGKVIGSHLGTRTIIKVGVDPALAEEFDNLKNELETINSDIEKSMQIIKLLSIKLKSNLLTEDKKEILQKTVKTSQFMQARRKEIIEKLEELKDKIADVDKGEIKIGDKMFTNIEVSIGNVTMNIRDEISRCTLRKEEDEIVQKPY